MSIGAWLAFFFLSAVTYTIFNWAPTYLTTGGLTLQQAMRAIVAHNAAAIAGSLGTGLVITRFGTRRMLVVQLATAMAMLGVLGSLLALDLTRPVVPITAAMTVLGAANGSAMATLYVLLTRGYAAGVRATAMGAGLAMGRLGAIVAVLAAGYVLDLSPRGSALHGAMIMALLLAMAGMWVINRHLAPGRA